MLKNVSSEDKFSSTAPAKNVGAFGICRYGRPLPGFISSHFRGVWFLHCHLERHLSWCMDTAFIVKNGHYPEAQLISPPPDMPPC
ncbi:hypothetical protein CIPAW_15G009700 [Carya illinoinensis]|uniref:Plastocyanin-like domain-containing protein n=1 Tax=Carya illinoinensis TaxID=32201 RepID=A0A8T1NA13_CARIL|nr:hypothetical protein CIPAW_15G009700 [Carya illinoinensis]